MLPSRARGVAAAIIALAGVAAILCLPPSLDGRLREIANEDDLGWPFAVKGEIDDETLISLVAFVRSRPALPDVPEGLAPQEEVKSWPLSVIVRQGDQFIAALRNGQQKFSESR